jgi:ABC-type xylose transport system permease subunit
MSGSKPATAVNRLNAQLDRFLSTLRTGETNLLGLLVLLAILFAIFAILLPGTFLRFGTMQAMMFQLPELGLLSLAMALPLVSGGLNLAIIATANQSALLMAWILTTQMRPDATGGDLAFWLTLARRLRYWCDRCLCRHASNPGHARHPNADRRHQHLADPRPHNHGFP